MPRRPPPSRHPRVDDGTLVEKTGPAVPIPGFVAAKGPELRYGENPHQSAAYYADAASGVAGIGQARQSFTNRIDWHISRGEDAEAQGFVSLEQVLAEADIITCHVPLTKGGSDATYHLLRSQVLMSLQRADEAQAAMRAYLNAIGNDQKVAA